MTSDDRFDELVVEWDRCQQQGENVSLQSLCEECPELLPKLRDYIASVSGAEWLVEDPPLDADELLTSELVSTQTVEQFSSCVLNSGLITADELEDIKSRYSALIQDTISLAEVLIREQKLTRFQANRICGGNCTGHILGDYVILDKIGAGGMGQVYKARHRRMKRVVAIKTLPPQTVNTPQALARFQREVEAAAMLDHQNIVTAYDAGDADGTPFLVMMYVDGRDLMEIVSDQGPLPVHIAVDYLCQAATGLSYAHNLGVVHRDIKPDNLMLDNAGTVRILDMGLARLEKSNESAEFAETQAALTHAGTVMGTVDFMSPEQALDVQDADARADIYSLGCTLYFLLTSRAPYGGKSLMAKMLAHREDPIPALPHNVPAELNDAYERSMAKDIADRYRTMDDFLTDLRQIELPELIIPSETNTTATPESQLPGVAVPVPSQPSETPPHSIETAAVELAETSITEPDQVPDSQLELELQSHHHSPSDLVAAPDPARTQATPQESTSSNFSGGRRRLIGLIALALLAGGGLLLNQLILEYNTQNGTIELHSNVADFEVEFDNQTEVVTTVDPIDNTKVKVDIPHGAKILRVRKGGFEAEVSDFVLNTLKGAVTVRFSSAVLHSEFPVAAPGNHQAVAGWVRSVGGRVSFWSMVKLPNLFARRTTCRSGLNCTACLFLAAKRSKTTTYAD